MPSSTDNCLSISPDCPVEATIYGYYPNLGANVFFAAFFGLFLIVQLLMGIKSKLWGFMISLTLGCLVECVGYAGRTIMHSNPWSNTGFEMQICCLIIAPAFVSAGIYLTLSNLVRTFGAEFSRLRPALYTKIFISADTFSLVLQGCGGGIAASATTDRMINIGSNIMLAGIVWQVASLIAFAILTVDYLVRVWRARGQLSAKATATAQSASFKLFCAGFLLAFVAIFTRCVYRIPEMSGGWANPIMRSEVDFIVLDGVMITIAVLALTVSHPGFCVPQLWGHGNVEPESSVRRSRLTSETSLSDAEKAMVEAK